MVRREPEVVFHLAGQRTDDFEAIVPDAQVNIIGALNVLEGARRAGARKMVVGSDGGALYGTAAASDLPIREKHLHHPLSPHGMAKKVLVDYLSLYREVHALEFTVLVLAEVYGPRQRRGLIVDLRNQIESGQVTLDPARTTDLVHVDDVVDAFVRAGEKGSGLVANVGSGVEISIGELVTALVTSLGCASPEISPGGGSHRFALDPGRARIHLGWTPWTELTDGLARLADER
jgi:UDP-glucose 4-epimerase